MLKPSTFLGIFFLLILASTQKTGVAPCPLQYQLGSVLSGTFPFTQLESPSPNKEGSSPSSKAKMFSAIIIHYLTLLLGFLKSQLVQII